MAAFPFDIVGFDLDGTLLDTHEDLGAAVNHALSGLGRRPIPAEAVAGLIGGGARRMLERALTLTGGVTDARAFDLAYAGLLTHYEAHIAVHTQTYPGTLEMLDALTANGIRLAVVSNKVERLVVKLLEALGMADRFAVVLGGDSLGPGRAKPAPDLLHAMVSRLGGGRAAFVGDSSFDMRAARAAGIPSVAVSFGFNDVAPDALGADTVIGHFSALIPALRRL